MNEETQDTPGVVNGKPCIHEDAVKWNPYNGIVQCHRCGEQFVPVGVVAQVRAEMDKLAAAIQAETGYPQTVEARLDHMQDRLNRQGARLRHLESLPGVAETIPTDKQAAE